LGALDDKSGGVFHGAKVFDHKQCHHRPDIYDGLMADVSADMLKTVFCQSPLGRFAGFYLAISLR